MFGDERSGTWRDATPMELAPGVGVCVVPGVFALVTWWFGWRIGAAVGLTVATTMALACWLLCQGGGDRGGGA